MSRHIGYVWHLRDLMAKKGLFNTTDLGPLLAERGIDLSAVQVYRLVVQTPERLSLNTLVALLDILGCSAEELIELVVKPVANRQRVNEDASPTPVKKKRPKPARVLEPKDQ